MLSSAEHVYIRVHRHVARNLPALNETIETLNPKPQTWCNSESQELIKTHHMRESHARITCANHMRESHARMTRLAIFSIPNEMSRVHLHQNVEHEDAVCKDIDRHLEPPLLCVLYLCEL